MRSRNQSPKSKTNGGLQFAISDVSKLLSVSPSTLRMWENMELILPERTPGGRRVYSPEQVERLKYIQSLREEKRLNIHAIRQMVGTTDKLRAGNGKVGGSIARHLRRLRRQQQLTLSAAAAGAGLSVGFLSSLELGRVNASVATLQKLAVFYKTHVQSFFGGPKKPRKLVRRTDRKRLSNEPGIEIDLLALGEHLMQPHLYTLAPGTSSGGAYHHEGEEFIYLFSGCCEIWLDEVEHYLLREGDSLYFSSTQTHRWSNPGPKPAVLLWVNTPPTF